MNITLKVDTAVEVPVNAVPLIDDTDFKTRETAVAYNASGMDLVWNFLTTAGVISQTAVTPTTGGVYDWVHEGDGMYSMEIPASGGGSINNDTEGWGWFSGFVTGVLPFRGPTICFAPAHVVDGLVTGSDNLQVDAVQFNSNATAAANAALFYGTIVTGSINDGAPAAAGFNAASGSLNVAADFYNDCFLVFTSGPLAGMSRKISDYSGSVGTYQFDFNGSAGELDAPFPGDPDDSNTFIIIARGE